MNLFFYLNRYILLIFLYTASQTSFAQNAAPKWIELHSNDKATISIDATSLKRKGDIVTGWSSYVLRNPTSSAKILGEYNCKTKQSRTLSSTAYENADFTGNSERMPPQPWDYVVRGSIGEEILELVCTTIKK
jgi:hypothetical protein